jgi:prepilin peptidase CpaA
MKLYLFFFLTVILLIAMINDLRFHRIPNWLTYSTILIAVFYHIGTQGIEGLLFSSKGIGFGIGVLIFPWLIGGMGAGDAKLMGAVGGILGAEGVLFAFLYSTIIGGVYAILLLGLNGQLKNFIKRYTRILKPSSFDLKEAGPALAYSEKKIKLCYGLPIAFGTLLSVLWRSTV